MRKFSRFVFALCVAALAMAPTAVERSYLKLDGVDGESTEAQHSKWFQLSSFSWGAGQGGGITGPACMTGPGAGPHTLSFTRTGRPSRLAQLAGQHTVIPSLTVEVGGERHLLENVTFASVQSRPAGGGNVTESITLNYSKCQTHSAAQAADIFQKRGLTPDLKLKIDSPNSILIGLTPKPEAVGLIGLLLNGDGHSARLTSKSGGGVFRQAFQSKQVVPSLTLTLNNGQKWTFTNVTIAGITDGTSKGTELVSLNFTKVEGPPAGFQDLSYKE